jgi:protein-glucosylgalactosylhydroxylysine glucosidase
MLSTFSNDWYLRLEHDAIVANPSDLAIDDGILVGNGKVCMYPSYDGIDLKRCMITSSQQSKQSSQLKNTVDIFVPTCMTLYDKRNNLMPLTLSNMELDMRAGSLESTFASSSNYVIHSKIRACRQYPNCVIQTLWIVPQFSDPDGEIGLKHEVHVIDRSMSDVSYNASMYDVLNSSMYVFSGQGTAKGTKMAFASSYVSDPEEFEPLGFNRSREDPDRGYNRLRLRPNGGLLSGTCYKLYAVTCLLTEDDFPDPVKEAPRILMHVLGMQGRSVNSDTTPLDSVHSLISGHVSEWTKLWQTNVSIFPKEAATSEEKDAINQGVNRHLRFALYNLYSSLRDGAILPRPLAGPNGTTDVSAIDNQSDLWLVPLMLVLRPSMARMVLDQRWQTLTEAVRLATSFGMKGAKYPSMNDDGLWEATSASNVFNSALVSISVWNYFRVTYDRDWLASKGYEILRSVADYVISAAGGGPGVDGKYHLLKVEGMNAGSLANDHAMTNNMARLALRYAIEASYELNMTIPKAWKDAYFTLPIAWYDDAAFGYPRTTSMHGVILPDANGTGHVPDLDQLDVLLPLVPLYSNVIFSTDGKSAPFVIQNSIEYYASTQQADASPFNLLTLALLSGVAAQQPQQTVSNMNPVKWVDDGFESRVNALLSDPDYVGHVWGNLLSPVRTGTYYDLSTGSLLVLSILLGVCGLQLKGGVSDSRFMYEAFAVSTARDAVMPRTWDSVRVSGSVTQFITSNKRLYTTP